MAYYFLNDPRYYYNCCKPKFMPNRFTMAPWMSPIKKVYGAKINKRTTSNLDKRNQVKVGKCDSREMKSGEEQTYQHPT